MRWSPRSSNAWGSRKVSVTGSGAFRQPNETDASKTAATAEISLNERKIPNRTPWMTPLLVSGALHLVAIWPTHQPRSQIILKRCREAGQRPILRGECTTIRRNQPSSFLDSFIDKLVRQAKRSSSVLTSGGKPIPKYNRQSHVERRILASWTITERSTVIASEPHHAG